MRVPRKTLLAVAITVTASAVVGAVALWPRPVEARVEPSSVAHVQRAAAESAGRALGGLTETGARPVGALTPLSADLLAARAQLAAWKRSLRHLDGVTVREEVPPQGKEAASFYTLGRIVLNPRNTHAVDVIMAHEVWHIIDWRDNGRIDWGEAIPPANATDYLK